mmetsp:Transcript_21863/g.51045  ORF Transcript_21863/g.51045 Transcript_21863/m.51045 type:complete len:239 (-) Transcript_21863:236-952(-)
MLLAEDCPLVVLWNDSMMATLVKHLHPLRCGEEAEAGAVVCHEAFVDLCKRLHRESRIRYKHELVVRGVAQRQGIPHQLYHASSQARTILGRHSIYHDEACALLPHLARRLRPAMHQSPILGCARSLKESLPQVWTLQASQGHEKEKDLGLGGTTHLRLLVGFTAPGWSYSTKPFQLMPLVVCLPQDLLFSICSLSRVVQVPLGNEGLQMGLAEWIIGTIEHVSSRACQGVYWLQCSI